MSESPLKALHPASTTYTEIGASTAAWDFGDLEGEYEAVRNTAARFDLNSAGLLEIAGDGAFDLLQDALARDLEFVTPEQSLISLILDEDGGVVDLVTAYLKESGDFRLETSIGRAPATAAHLEKLRDAAGLEVEIADLAGKESVILIEGPTAAKVLEELIDPDLGALPLSGLMEVEFQGVEISVSRTGFTGEYGYKIFSSAEDAPKVWEALDSVTAAGIGALEIAMFEVRQPLLHREIVDGATALETGYSWLMDITKESFHGRDAVQDAFDGGTRSRVVGFTAAGGTAPVKVGSSVTIGGEEVGTVIHSVYSPGRKDLLGLVSLRPDLVSQGIELTITGGGADGTDLAATTASAPYILPNSWTAR